MKLRFLFAILALLVAGLLAAACADEGETIADPPGDGGSSDVNLADRSTAADRNAPDADPDEDAGSDSGGATDASDSGFDAGPPTPAGSIAAARVATDGAGKSLPIVDVTITYLRPQIGDPSGDPAGFTVQATQDGPALFIAVNPASVTPAPAVGDVVSFTITQMATHIGQRRATAITSYSRASTGANVAALTQTVTAATNLVSAGTSYDSEIVDVTGAIAGPFETSGPGFQAASITTTGMPTLDPNLVLRLPSTLRDARDIAPGCNVTLHRTPIQRITSQTQLTAFVTADIDVSGCPAPTVESAVALSATSVRVTFSRNVLGTSVDASGSQFVFDNGLSASAASVNGRTVTLTTSAQVGGTSYTVVVANTVTDLAGTALGMPNSAVFPAFVQRAVVRINELNANIANGCDLIELRVVSGGSMQGFKITERTGNAVNNELSLTFGALTVAKNDFIVVHTNSGNATCNPGASGDETTSVAQHPVATFGRNFDTAWDWYSADNGLTATDNVITLYDPTGAIMDAVFVSDDPAGASTASATETQAAVVGDANQWSPKLASYIDAVFRMHAADDLNQTGTTPAGTSIQRVDDTDDDDKADWTTGAGAASTWGALNANQTAF